MRARDVMSGPALTVAATTPNEAVAALQVSHGIASAPVHARTACLLVIGCPAPVGRARVRCAAGWSGGPPARWS